MFLTRDISQALIRFSLFPVIGIFGPRQSGKTTIARNQFKNYIYLNFEDFEIAEFATQEPKNFLKKYENKHGIILDEFHHVPKLLSYIQLEVDEKNRPGYFVLTGSHNFLMNQAITQSLAGRIGILTLLPLSLHECTQNNIVLPTEHEAMVHGSYPNMYTKQFLPSDFYPAYIRTYIERDVRLLTTVENLLTFHTFMKLCAGRIGQLLNIASLAADCGITQKTAEGWLSILAASYIIFLLTPYHNNFNKRVIKTPKLYFYDSGIACSLLGIKSAEELSFNPYKGHLFESFIIADLYKQYYNQGSEAPLYFWRDRNGLIEIDCLIHTKNKLIPIEIKSGHTIASDFFKSLNQWNEMAQMEPTDGYLIYAGDQIQKRNKGTVLGWRQTGTLITQLEAIT